MSRFSYFGSEKIKVIISTVNKKQLEESLKRQVFEENRRYEVGFLI